MTAGLHRQQRIWEANADEDALWAILSDPSKRQSWTDEEFFETGRRQIAGVMEDAGSLGLQPGGEEKVALDFGCGVGRLSQGLVPYFGQVFGVDISSKMIEMAKNYNQHGERCLYFVNSEPNLALFPDDSFDFIYTTLVLQHIPSAIAEIYLQEFTRVCKPGGLLAFQIPDRLRSHLSWLMKLRILYLLDYRVYSLLHRLGLGEKPMRIEMHGVRREKVESILAQNGCTLLKAAPDRSAWGWDSYMYWACKGDRFSNP